MTPYFINVSGTLYETTSRSITTVFDRLSVLLVKVFFVWRVNTVLVTRIDNLVSPNLLQKPSFPYKMVMLITTRTSALS